MQGTHRARLQVPLEDQFCELGRTGSFGFIKVLSVILRLCSLWRNTHYSNRQIFIWILTLDSEDNFRHDYGNTSHYWRKLLLRTTPTWKNLLHDQILLHYVFLYSFIFFIFYKETNWKRSNCTNVRYFTRIRSDKLCPANFIPDWGQGYFKAQENSTSVDEVIKMKA